MKMTDKYIETLDKVSKGLKYTDIIKDYVFETSYLPLYYDERVQYLKSIGVKEITLFDVIDGCREDSEIIRDFLHRVYNLTWKIIESNIIPEMNNEIKIGVSLIMRLLHIKISRDSNPLASFDIMRQGRKRYIEFLRYKVYDQLLPNYYLDIARELLLSTGRTKYLVQNYNIFDTIGLSNIPIISYVDEMPGERIIVDFETS